MKSYEETRAALFAAIDALAPAWIDPPVLQPAGLYLELSGEDIRRRAFVIDDRAHGELCLRPDMTVPAVRAAFAMNKLPALVAYEGQVFRRQEPGSTRESEFVQIGAEWIDSDGDGAAREAEIIVAALEACRKAGVEPDMKLGDVGVLAGFVEALGLAGPWPARTLRALGRPGGLAALKDMAAHVAVDEGAALAEALAGLSPEHAADAVRDALAIARITPVGGRPIEEIAERLRQRGALAKAPAPSPAQFDLLDNLTAIDGADGLAQARKLAESKALAGAGPALKALDAAEARLAALKPALPAATSFAPGLGRVLTYYDGFVFELEAKALGDRASLGGGGRYDGLARALWPSGPAPAGLRAAGFALRPQRLAEAAR